MSAPNELAFRDAGPDDWPLVAALHAASWRASYRGILANAYLDGPVEEDRRAVWRGRLAEGGLDANAVVLLAFAAGRAEPEGFCCILPGHDPRWGALIDNLHVRPGATRRRVGRRVLRAAITRLGPGDAARPVHLTVFAANARARAAYARWGGRDVERMDIAEPDGGTHPVHRYAWDDPRTLLAQLG